MDYGEWLDGDSYPFRPNRVETPTRVVSEEEQRAAEARWALLMEEKAAEEAAAQLAIDKAYALSMVGEDGYLGFNEMASWATKAQAQAAECYAGSTVCLLSKERKNAASAVYNTRDKARTAERAYVMYAEHLATLGFAKEAPVWGSMEKVWKKIQAAFARADKAEKENKG